MKKFHNAFQVISSVVMVLLIGKSILFIYLYKRVEYLNHRDLIDPSILPYEKLITRISVNGKSYMDEGFILNEAFTLVAYIIILLFLIMIINRAISNRDFLNDLLPFSNSWQNHINLGIRRLLGILLGLVFYAVPFTMLLYISVLFLDSPLDNVFYEQTNQAFTWSAIGFVFLYLVMWLFFFVFAWLYLGFTNQRVTGR